MGSFKITLKSEKHRGKVSTDDIRIILDSIDTAYYQLLGMGRDPHRRKKIDVLIKTTEGSFCIEYFVDCLDEEIREKSDRPWEEIIKFISNPESARKEDMATLNVLLKLKRIEKNKYKKIIFSYNGREEELKPKWFEKTENIIIEHERKEEGDIIIWGKLMEGDFRDKKFQCRLIPLKGREVRCIYPQRLEERIHYFLHPLRRDVIIKGKKLKEGVVEIMEIEGQGGLFDYKVSPTKKPVIEDFFGIAKDIEESADEITSWMKKIIWEDNDE